MSTPFEERPVEVEGAPAEEGVSQADAAERVDLDPEQQVNYTDAAGPDNLTDVGEDRERDGAGDPGEPPR